MSGFRDKARSAVIWNTGFNLFRDGLQFVTMLVLIRMLPQAAYGHFGVVTSIVGFINIFSLNNFIAHALQVKEDGQARFQEHFTAGAVLNIAMCIVANLVAVALRHFDQWVAIAPLLHVMSLTFLLEWPCEVRRKMIEREFDWKTLRILHAIGLVMTAATALSMAWAGLGSYALLVPALAVTIPFSMDLFFRIGWRPTWQWSWKIYKPSFDFALARIGSGLVLNGRQLLEATMLAYVLGFTGLGVLNRSIGLAQLFCLKIATQLVYAIYPILTRIEDKDGNAARIGSLVLQTVAWSTIPLAVLFGVLAFPVVNLIYGEKWLDVVPLIPWAMAWGVTAAVFHSTYMLLLARHGQKRCLVADTLVLAGSALSLWLMLPLGTVYYLVGITASQLTAVVFIVTNLHRADAMTFDGWFRPLSSGLVSAAVAGAGTCLVFYMIDIGVPTSFLPAVMWGGLFSLLYLLCIRLVFRVQLEAWLNYIPAKKQVAKVLLLTEPNERLE